MHLEDMAGFPHHLELSPKNLLCESLQPQSVIFYSALPPVWLTKKKMVSIYALQPFEILFALLSIAQSVNECKIWL